MLGKMFRPKKEEATGEWRRLHGEELHDCTAHQTVLGCSYQEG